MKEGEGKAILMLVFVFVAVVLLSTNPSFTGSIVNDGEISKKIVIEDALPGTTIEKTLTLSIEGDALEGIKLAENGDMKDLLQLEETTFTLVPNQEVSVPLTITIPEDLPQGNYDAKVVIISEDLPEERSVLNDQIIQYLEIEIHVGDEVKEGLALEEVQVFDAEEGTEVYTSLALENKGNTEIEEDVSLKVYKDGRVVFEETLPFTLQAYEENSFVYSLGVLPLGSYTAVVDNQKEISFEVKENVVKKGEILFTDIYYLEKGTSQMDVYFLNTGEGVLHVSLEQEVESEKENTKEVSDVVTILPNEYYVFTSSYRLDGSAQYTFAADVVADNFALDHSEEQFYNPQTISLETNFYVLFGLVVGLLVIGHYVLSRKRATRKSN